MGLEHFPGANPVSLRWPGREPEHRLSLSGYLQERVWSNVFNHQQTVLQEGLSPPIVEFPCDFVLKQAFYNANRDISVRGFSVPRPPWQGLANFSGTDAETLVQGTNLILLE